MSKQVSKLGHHSSKARKPGSSKAVRMEPGGRGQVASEARSTTAAFEQARPTVGRWIISPPLLVTDRDMPLTARQREWTIMPVTWKPEVGVMLKRHLNGVYLAPHRRTCLNPAALWKTAKESSIEDHL